MKRPPEGAISEGDLRQRIVQLERIDAPALFHLHMD